MLRLQDTLSPGYFAYMTLCIQSILSKTRDVMSKVWDITPSATVER